jgi:nitrous oxide reductase accessory protein NosL
MMKQTLFALFAIAAMTAVSASMAAAQMYGGGQGRPPNRPEAFIGSGRSDNCRMVITHRRGPNGSITVRRRICD